MRIDTWRGLPVVSGEVVRDGVTSDLPRVVLDTGSARTIIRSEDLNIVGPPAADAEGVHRVRGVGGYEFVLTDVADELRVGDMSATRFEVQIGTMEYGFEINAILGFDFLTQVGAMIDLSRLELRKAAD